MKEKIYVWDPFVRSFHWLLLLAFVTSYITGEEESSWHVYSGYLIATLIVLRILWGFVGTRHARFSDFVRPPAEAIKDLQSTFEGHPERHLGHNPAGGLMIIALLTALSITVLSGMAMLGTRGEGPLAMLATSGSDVGARVLIASSSTHDDDDENEEEDEDSFVTAREGLAPVSGRHGEEEAEDEREELLEELHEFGVNFTLLLILLHVSGVVLTSLAQRENLVSAMLSGYKNAESETR